MKILPRYLRLMLVLFITLSFSATLGITSFRVYAAGTVSPPCSSGTVSPPPGGGTVSPPCCDAGHICNPLLNIDNLCQLVNAILNIITQIGAIIGVLFIIYSGFLFIKAQGNEKGLTDAKSTLYTTLIGLAILLGASVIAKIILTTISGIIGGDSGTCAL